MTFQRAQERLLEDAKMRIRNGEMTERGLARMLGISQPHIHNVLKGVRALSPPIADKILTTFNLSLAELYPPQELATFLEPKGLLFLRDTPIVEGRIGLQSHWRPDERSKEKYASPVRDPQTRDVVAVRIDPDEEMVAVIRDADIVSVQVPRRIPVPLPPQQLYAVDRPAGAAIRYVRLGTHCVYLATVRTLDRPLKWERLACERIEDVVQGKVLWIAREKDRRLPLPQRGRVLDMMRS